jgi:hypothetical protein
MFYPDNKTGMAWYGRYAPTTLPRYSLFYNAVVGDPKMKILPLSRAWPKSAMNPRGLERIPAVNTGRTKYVLMFNVHGHKSRPISRSDIQESQTLQRFPSKKLCPRTRAVQKYAHRWAVFDESLFCCDEEWTEVRFNR